MVTRILMVLVIYCLALPAFADGRDIKPSRTCTKSETEHAIAFLELQDNGDLAKEREAQISLLFACYGAEFALEEKLLAGKGSVVNYRIRPLNLMVTHSQNFVRIQKLSGKERK